MRKYKNPPIGCRIEHKLLGNSPSGLFKCTLGIRGYCSNCENCRCNIELLMADVLKDELSKLNVK